MWRTFCGTFGRDRPRHGYADRRAAGPPLLVFSRAGWRKRRTFPRRKSEDASLHLFAAARRMHCLLPRSCAALRRRARRETHRHGDQLQQSIRRHVQILAVDHSSPGGDRLGPSAPASYRGRAITEGYAQTNCEVGAGMARRLGCERTWRPACCTSSSGGAGKAARRLRGEEIALSTRVAHVAGYAALFDRLGGGPA